MGIIMKFFGCFLVLLCLMMPIFVFADESSVIKSTKAESNFPDGIRFTINIYSDVDIDDIRVKYKKTKFGASHYAYLDCSGTVCETDIKSIGGGFFPPGTKFFYFFEGSLKNSESFITDERVYTYIDQRFEWQYITKGAITVYYYGDYIDNRARTVLDASYEALELMGPILGVAPTESLNIVMYNNYRHMAPALPFKSQSTRENLITEGMAFGDNRVLLVLGFGENVRGITSHEFVHLLVHEAAGTAISKVPSWLNEGLAEVGNIDPTEDYRNAFMYAYMTRRVKPLWYLHEFVGTSDEVIMAYGIGDNATRFLIGKYGKENISYLFKEIQKELDFDKALQNTYGMTEHELDSEWRKAIGLPTLPPPDELEMIMTNLKEGEGGMELKNVLIDTPSKDGQSIQVISKKFNYTYLYFFALLVPLFTVFLIRKLFKKWIV